MLPLLTTLPPVDRANLPRSGSRAANARQPDTFCMGNDFCVCAAHPKTSASPQPYHGDFDQAVRSGRARNLGASCRGGSGRPLGAARPPGRGTPPPRGDREPTGGAKWDGVAGGSGGRTAWVGQSCGAQARGGQAGRSCAKDVAGSFGKVGYLAVAVSACHPLRKLSRK